MRFKITTLAFILLITNIVYSNPNFVIQTGLHMDKYGQLIQPDKLFLSNGIKQYRDGYNQLAFMYFKKSSALGNTMAQRLVGLMYVNGLGVEKSLVQGYVWLKLAAIDKTPRNIKLAKQVNNLLNSQQRQGAQTAYHQVNEVYGTIASLTRRDKWVRSQKLKITGTHAGSIVFSPLIYDTPHGNGFFNQIYSYVNEYNFGYVTPKEIIAKIDEE